MEPDNHCIILPFGIHKGKSLKEIPDDYLCNFLCERGKGIFYKDAHSLEQTWKVPIQVWAAARDEAERRGIIKKGSHWEYANTSMPVMGGFQKKPKGEKK
jgi:hypothetical protein